MNKIKVPNQLMLGGRTIEVVADRQAQYRENANGIADYRPQKISLQPSTLDFPVRRDQIEEYFLHELVHWILYMMNHELRSNEEFVGIFAEFLHQALVTSEGDFFDCMEDVDDGVSKGSG